MITSSKRGARNLLTLAGFLALAVVSALAAYVGTADAYPDSGFYAFCPPFSNSSVIITSGSRCVSHGIRTDDISGQHSVNTGVSFCVVGKQYSDGSGGNDTPANCNTNAIQLASITSSPVSTYGTIINRSGDAHYMGEYTPR